MSQLLINFLKLSKIQLSSESTLKNGYLHVVMGNEACDLDSAVCALCLACHLHYISATPSTTYIPILNINRIEYRLKTEVSYLLLTKGIDESLLTFKDDLDLITFQKEHRLQITLVDFNKLNNNILDDCVVQIIDHHVNKRNDQVPSIIETVGSCATLVAEFITKDGGGQLTKEISFMELLYAAILLDTACLENPAKTTEKDINVINEIEKGNILDRRKFYQKLENARNYVKGLSVVELLLKDMKVVRMAEGQCTLSIAISSIRLHPATFFTKDSSQNILESFKSFADDNKHHVVIMMFVKSERYLALFSENSAMLEQTIAILKNHDHPSLCLCPIHADQFMNPESISSEKLSDVQPVKTITKYDNQLKKNENSKNKCCQSESERDFKNVIIDGRVILFRQGNVNASRKVVQPIVENHLHLIFKLI